MKIAPHWKYRLFSLISIVGFFTVIFTADPLIDYYEETSTYIEKMEPLLDKLEQHSSNFQNDPKVAASEYNKISNEIRQARFFNEPSMETLQASKYLSARFHIGIVAMLIGLCFAEKYKPKPKEKSPDPDPANPWDSLPIPELKKNSATNDQD